jgi:hypothetical protein
MTRRSAQTTIVTTFHRTTRRELVKAWVSWVTLGECVGFGVPAVAGSLARDAAAGTLLVALVMAGSVEGAVLGWAQAHVLRGVVRGFDAVRWIVVTAVAAAVAWLLGMLPSTFVDVWTDWSIPVRVAVAVLLTGALLCSIGVAQWTVLRRYVERAGRWILVTALAWSAGLIAFTAVTSPLWQEGQSTAVIAAIGALGGVVMALTMALVTGWGLTRLLWAGRPLRGR